MLENENLNEPQKPQLNIGAVSGSFHYTLDDVKNIKANAQFIKNKQVPIEAFGITEWMEMVMKLADDCLAARNDR